MAAVALEPRVVTEWPLPSAYHVCRCGELYMKICILTMIKGYKATMLSVWICATG